MTSRKVFFSYMREDSKWAPFALYEHIRRLLPNEDLFLDRHSIPAGKNWLREIEKALDECDVFLALIGPNWMNELLRRQTIEGQEDVAEIEIAKALTRYPDLLVLPILIDGAAMPEAAALGRLSELSRVQATTLRIPDFYTDGASIMQSISQYRSSKIMSGGFIAAAIKEHIDELNDEREIHDGVERARREAERRHKAEELRRVLEEAERARATIAETIFTAVKPDRSAVAATSLVAIGGANAHTMALMDHVARFPEDAETIGAILERRQQGTATVDGVETPSELQVERTVLNSMAANRPDFDKACQEANKSSASAHRTRRVASDDLSISDSIDCEHVNGNPQSELLSRAWSDAVLDGSVAALQEYAARFPETTRAIQAIDICLALTSGRFSTTCISAPWVSRLSHLPELTEIYEGSFLMGGRAKYSQQDERPTHRVDIHKRFLVGRFPVTMGEWSLAVQDGECRDVWEEFPEATARHPVQGVSWLDANRYVDWLSKKHTHRFRLLTEPEWEYCCRAGTSTAFFFGDDIMDLQIHANVRGISTSEVGIFSPNRWGLYDMLGNVNEWTSDYYKPYGRTPEPYTWLYNTRVLRGGSYETKQHVTSSWRNSANESNKYKTFGVRVACNLD